MYWNMTHPLAGTLVEDLPFTSTMACERLTLEMPNVKRNSHCAVCTMFLEGLSRPVPLFNSEGEAEAPPGRLCRVN